MQSLRTLISRSTGKSCGERFLDTYLKNSEEEISDLEWEVPWPGNAELAQGNSVDIVGYDHVENRIKYEDADNV